MQAQYTREVNHCYMILQSSEPFDENSYELNMIAANRIPSLLPMSVSHIDQTAICQYDISSLQPFSVFCSSHKLHRKELTGLFGNLLDSLFLMEDYLLSTDHLFLDPEYLYLNWSALELRIAYVPFYSCSLKTSLLNLMEYLLGCLGNDDQETVVLAYRICHELKEPNFQLGDLKRLLLPELQKRSDAQDPAAEEFSAPLFDSRLSSSNCSHGAYGSTDMFSSSGQTPSAGSKRDRLQIPDESPDSVSGTAGLKKFLPERETWKTVFLGVPAAVIIYAVLHIYALGYLPLIKAVYIIACILALFVLFLILLHKRHISSDSSSKETLSSFSSKPEEMQQYNSFYDAGSSNVHDPIYSSFPSDSNRNPQEEHSASLFEGSSSLYAPFPEDERTVLLRPSSEQHDDPASVQRLVPVKNEHHANLPVIDLDRDSLLIGFQSGVCDKVIPDPTVSRIHARIEKRDGTFYLTDLSSRNGTFVDDRELGVQEEIPLQADMRIRFGAAEFKVQ